MTDPTETARRQRLAEINTHTQVRQELEEKYGQVWTTSEMQADFTAEGFLAPYIVVRRKSDGVRGTLEFQHDPRLYYDFQPE